MPRDLAADEIPSCRSWGSPELVRYARLACLAAVSSSRPCVFAGASGAATSATHAKGIDVSNWNGSINWTKVAHAGYRFAIAKATEATNYRRHDVRSEPERQRGRRHRLRRVPLRPPVRHEPRRESPRARSRRPTTSSRFATPQPGELPPVLDLEATGNLSAHLSQAWTKAWAQEVYARLGVQPFVYSSPAFWQEHLADSTVVAAAGTPLWIAHWTSASKPWVPAQNWNGLGWTFWQWTRLRLRARHRPLHRRRPDERSDSRLARDRAVLDRRARALDPAEHRSGLPEAGKLLAAVPGVWNGGKPLAFTYQWRQCDAAGANCVDIPGATRETYRPTTDDVGHSLSRASSRRATAHGHDEGGRARNGRRLSRRRPADRAAGERRTAGRARNARRSARSSRATAGAWTGSPTKFALPLAALRRERAQLRRDREGDALERTRRRRTISARRSPSSSRRRAPAVRGLRARRRSRPSSPLRRCRRSRRAPRPSSRASPATSGRSTAARPRRGSRAPCRSGSPSASTPRQEPRPRRQRRRAQRPRPARAPASSGPSRSTTRTPRPAQTVLGYSTDGTVFDHACRNSAAASLRARTEGRRVCRRRRDDPSS